MHTGLQALFEEDQADRAEHPAYESDAYRALRARDAERRAQADAIMAHERDLSPEDLYHAALLFQHGDRVEEIGRARELALNSAEKGYRPARWLAAAALDRWLMYQGLPQKYGTNIVPDGRRHRLWDVDPATSDRERAAWDVPPLAEMERRAADVTRTGPMPPMDDAPDWLKAAVQRWYPEAGDGDRK